MAPDLTNDRPSILKDGELEPGIYKIQNIYSETFLDIHVHSREVVVPSKILGREGACKFISVVRASRI